MKLSRCLRKIEFLACQFVHDRAKAAQAAAEIGIVVAALDGVMPDDGKAIAFATAALLTAGCAGMREFSLQILVNEIRTSLRTVGEYP